MKSTFLTLFAAAFTLSAAAGSIPSASLDACNVVWDSPSADSKGSMPIGNGDIGLNVWVEPSGDLCFFIGKTDAWLSDLEKQADTIEKISMKSRRKASLAWWKEYWNRSWIVIEDSKTAQGAPLPVNSHPWRRGMDSTGASRFRGEITGAQVIGHALADAEITALAAAPRPTAGSTITGADASFKLHASKNTIVEGRVENGKILDLKVTPESRRKDVEILPVQ